ncbi:MAG: hypothetical protein IPK10_13380 [Bacteroidetes bacterium]|nr:hypothetical protein [Bacteroidota bacterium]
MKTNKSLHMKKLLLLIILMLPLSSFGQYRYYFLKEYFFSRQNSARAEAMGKGYVSIDGDLASTYFNPAGIATLKGIELNGSSASPFYSANKARYTYLSAGYHINKYLSVALSRNHFIYGDNIFTDQNGNPLNIDEPYDENYCLSLASEPIKNLLIGLNANHFIWQPTDKKLTTQFYDFGIIKKFSLPSKNLFNRSFSIGASVVNLNNARITYYESQIKNKNSLPVITRYGFNYQMSLENKVLIDTLTTFKILVQGEVQDLLNSKYESALRTGMEIQLLEILSLRMGYYKEFVYDYDFPEVNYDQISSFTYGFGVQAPIHKLTKLPLLINFDFTSLPQPPYSQNNFSFRNFETYSLRINWLIGNKNNIKIG